MNDQNFFLHRRVLVAGALALASAASVAQGTPSTPPAKPADNTYKPATWVGPRRVRKMDDVLYLGGVLLTLGVVFFGADWLKRRSLRKEREEEATRRKSR
jgi:predicted membrane channel-forming protein YqfA (hemolysin III family)